MYQQSETLKSLYGISHGFFGKSGGVSKGIYDSLNCGPASLDSIDNVIENRWRAIHALGLQESKLFGLKQIHSTTVHVITGKSSDDFHEGDALVTNVKGFALSVLGADCAPVLFADRKAGVIAAAHSGWKGAVSGVIESVVSSMCEQGATRANIHACIGPTIHQDSYEVRDDFIKQLELLSDFNTDKFISRIDGKSYFDLPAYILTQCELSQINSESLGIDTYMGEDEYFSFRRNTHANETEYGRQISVIALR
ncbi:MAG: peptidoglycan editing factor PgeF [Cocleimonas sp.]